MADPRFFKKSGDFTLEQIADLTGSELNQVAKPNHIIKDVAPLDKADQSHASFLDNIKYKDQFEANKAGAVFVSEDIAQAYPDFPLLISKHPYKAYALFAQALYPENKPDENISEQAFIDPTAEIGAGATIEAGVFIGAGVSLGGSCWIEAGAVIKDNVQIGHNCHIGHNASLSHCVLGDHSRIYPGARIGQDGFGFAIDPSGYVKVPQLGRVIIGSHVEIGANTTIDRGAGPDTEIGDGTWIDNLVQVGHNVKIGRGCIIVSQVGISGSTIIEDYVALGGQVGVAGHLHIGQGARIAAQSGIMRDVPAGEEYMGSPSMPIKQYMRQVATLNRLAKRKKSS